MTTDTPSCTRRREEDDGVAQQLDVVLQDSPLLVSELRLGGIKLQPMWDDK